ncbi:sodium-potassium ATPase [Crassisporium funariophilum]|nr:sodium-potassium ATPase [Crassisporium funariophilum]
MESPSVESFDPELQKHKPLEAGPRGPGAITYATTSRNDNVPSRHAEPGTRLPIEFRTLSIHVDTRASGDAGKDGEKRKLAVKELVGLDWHKISTEEALTRLAVSPKTGLDKAQAQRRLQQNGKNVISPPKSNILRKLLEWVLGGFGSLLFAAAIVCFIAWKPLGEPNPAPANLALAVVLLLVLMIQAVFNAWQDFSTSRVMASIKGMLPSDVLVLRDCGQTNVAAKDLVPGDLVTISMGEKVPADLRLIEVSADLQFDRSILTGESEPVSGRVAMTEDNFLETKNIALQGTHCVSGSGLGLVIQTGDKTVFGVIAKLSAMEQTRLTTLQRELLRFVAIIAGLATAVAIIIVILWAAWLRRSFPNYINVPTLLIDVVSVMVAFIPEGLPVAVTLSLAKVANKLSNKLILCKSLSIVETLGSVNVLCSDKTGTLTQNIMHVENLAVFDTVYESKSFHTALSGAAPDAESSLRQIAAIGAICNAATFDTGHPSSDSIDNNGKTIVGNATDVAILRFADSIASAEITRNRWVNVFRSNFNSKTKIMLQLSELSSATSLDGPPVAPLARWDDYTRGCFLLSVKGAPEVILPRCSHVLDPSGGAPIALSPAVRNRICDVQERWSRRGQRVLLLARRVVRDNWMEKSTDRQSEEFAEVVEEYNRDLIVVGLVGLMDPLKPDIAHTVSVCRSAGIRFFIITGDHPTTALSIAGQAGIITNINHVHRISDLDPSDEKTVKAYDSDSEVHELKSIIITGPELMTLNGRQVEQLCQYEEIVFARTTPEQKLRIVHDFKNRGNVVAVTGDGVNDAPSLKAADCGIAMGQGSDVAKEAADLVLLGEFSSIIVAIEYGRLVFDNLKKTVLYLLPAGSFSELIPIVLNILIGVPQILSSIQMIIICVATDVLPALSLCLEEPEEGLLLRKPRNVKTDRLADWRLLLQAYGFLGILESLCASAMAFWYLQRNGVPFSEIFLGFGTYPEELTNDLLYRAQSVYFFTLVLMQWGNLLATRGRRLSILKHTPGKNWYIFPSAILALVIGIFFCYVPWFQKIFQTRPVPVEHFFIPMTFGLSLLILDELRKLIVRKFPKGILARLAW